MTLIDVCDAIVATLCAAFPTWTVEQHGGQFNESEVPILLAKCPALLVSILDIPEFLPHGAKRYRGSLKLAIYVFGKDGDQDRATWTLSTVFSLLALLQGQRWGLSDALLPVPDTISAENLYSGHVNNLRVALWVVSWTQSFTLTLESSL